jgi:20S proteasome subunit alpha 2
VLATEKKQKTALHDDRSINKIECISKNVGMVYSGMGPDYRLLVKYGRKLAQEYIMMYEDSIPTVQLVRRVADVMQEYTQSGLVF